MEEKLYIEITAGEESYVFTKDEALKLIASEFDRVEREKRKDDYGYVIDWRWMTEEEYNEINQNPDKPTFE